MRKYRKPFNKFVEKFSRWPLSFITGFILSALLMLALGIYPNTFVDSRNFNSVIRDFKNDYEYKLQTSVIKPDLNPSIIVWGNSKGIIEYCDNYKNSSEDNSIISVYKKTDSDLLSNLPFFKIDYLLYSKTLINTNDDGSNMSNLELNNLTVSDIDNDGSDEIITRGNSYTCGSGGFSYLFIFGDKDGKMSLISTLPDDPELNMFTFPLKVRINGVKTEITATNWDNQIFLQSIHNKIQNDLVIAYSLYFNAAKFGITDSIDECHACAHNYLIVAYKFENGKFVRDYEWNKGNYYITPNKIDNLEDIRKIINSF